MDREYSAREREKYGELVDGSEINDVFLPMGEHISELRKTLDLKKKKGHLETETKK